MEFGPEPVNHVERQSVPTQHALAIRDALFHKQPMEPANFTNRATCFKLLSRLRDVGPRFLLPGIQF